MCYGFGVKRCTSVCFGDLEDSNRNPSPASEHCRHERYSSRSAEESSTLTKLSLTPSQFDIYDATGRSTDSVFLRAARVVSGYQAVWMCEHGPLVSGAGDQYRS